MTFCELILKDSVGKGATQCTFYELINKRPASIIRDVRVFLENVLKELNMPPSSLSMHVSGETLSFLSSQQHHACFVGTSRLLLS